MTCERCGDLGDGMMRVGPSQLGMLYRLCLPCSREIARDEQLTERMNMIRFMDNERAAYIAAGQADNVCSVHSEYEERLQDLRDLLESWEDEWPLSDDNKGTDDADS